jgi:DNA polymerase-3 subunit epsilon
MELALLRVDIDRASGLPAGAVQVYDGLEDPGIPIPKEVQDITGITPAMVQGQKLDEARIAALLQDVDLVIAHNAGFDRPFVEARLGGFRELKWACSFADIPWKAQGRKSAKLESLAQDMGWFYDAHRAEMDCHALLAVLAVHLPQRPHTGLAHLVEQADKPSYRLMATHMMPRMHSPRLLPECGPKAHNAGATAKRCRRFDGWEHASTSARGSAV